jgi:hypothetical protein
MRTKTLLLATLLTAGCGAQTGGAPEPAAAPEAAAAAPGAAPDAAVPGDAEGAPVLLFGMGVHIEPAGLDMNGEPTNNQRRAYQNPAFYRSHAEAIDKLARLVERYNGRLTVQSQDPFTTTLVEERGTLLKDLRARGHEIGLHFHDPNHLGADSASLEPAVWCEEIKRQRQLIEQGGGGPPRYLSGGATYEHILEVADCAGLEWFSDFKRPGDQLTPESLMGVNPWRPAGGPTEESLEAFTSHDPEQPIVFLPNGLFEANNAGARDRKEIYGGEDGYMDFVGRSLQKSLEVSRADRVNVFHITVHPTEFHGEGDDYAAIERFLRDILQPLIDAGQVKWATYSEMGEAWEAWEAKNPGVPPRPEEAG